MTDADTDWDAVSFVTRSTYRKTVIDVLAHGPDTPSGIVALSDIGDIAKVSRALAELREEGLVRLLVDESTQKGRYYGLTDGGKDVAAEVCDESE